MGDIFTQRRQTYVQDRSAWPCEPLHRHSVFIYACPQETTHLIGATENAGVEKAGADSGSGKCRSKSYGTPNRDYFERILSYLNLVR